MLEKFRLAKQAEIDRLEAEGVPAPLAGTVRPGFAAALLAKGPGAVIAEYKRASPSKGEINLGLPPEEAARAYAAAGAAAVSVLTEEVYFKGSLDYLGRMAGAGLPLLRKDFILHPMQVLATLATPASALLLVVRMLDDRALRELHDLTHARGLEAVVEVFDEEDLRRARGIGARMIQVNNRDLDTLAVDLGVSRRFIRDKAPGEVWISASGVSRPEEAAELASLGFDALLVGTSLMSSADPGAALAGLVRRGAK